MNTCIGRKHSDQICFRKMSSTTAWFNDSHRSLMPQDQVWVRSLYQVHKGKHLVHPTILTYSVTSLLSMISTIHKTFFYSPNIPHLIILKISLLFKYKIYTEKPTYCKCKVWWISSKWTHPCNKHPDQETKYFQPPGSSYDPFQLPHPLSDNHHPHF